MAELKGRDVDINIDGSIATARTKSFTVNNESIDVTSDNDDGVQRLLNGAGQKAVETSVSGMFDEADTTLLDLSMSAEPTQTVTFDFGTFTVSGTFFMTSFEVTGEYNDAVQFSASFSSSGAFAKTVPSS